VAEAEPRSYSRQAIGSVDSVLLFSGCPPLPGRGQALRGHDWGHPLPTPLLTSPQPPVGGGILFQSWKSCSAGVFFSFARRRSRIDSRRWETLDSEQPMTPPTSFMVRVS